MESMSEIRKMILAALLLALSIVLSRFLSIKTPLLAISFNFVPIILSGVFLGPKYSTVIAGLSDLIGAILFPFGEFFIGFTISALLMGFIYGVVLYKKDGELSRKELIIRLIVSSVLVLGGVNLGLGTLWLSIMYDKAFLVLLGTRAVKELIMLPIQVIVMFLIMEGLRKVTKKEGA